jgi:hypothetical protein
VAHFSCRRPQVVAGDNLGALTGQRDCRESAKGVDAGQLIPKLARNGLQLQQLIELGVAAVLGADRLERSEERLGYRNGYRTCSITTQVGVMDLMITKLQEASCPRSTTRRTSIPFFCSTQAWSVDL